MTEAEQLALLGRVAALEAQLATTLSGIPLAADEVYERVPEGGVRLVMPSFATVPVRTDTSVVSFRSLAYGEGLPRGYRDLRRLATVVALCQGDVIPGRMVPRSYVRPMKALYASRKAGRSLQQALVEAGLETPTPGGLLETAETLRQALPRLWETLRPVLCIVSKQSGAVGASDLLSRVRQLMI